MYKCYVDEAKFTANDTLRSYNYNIFSSFNFKFILAFQDNFPENVRKYFFTAYLF